MQATVDRLVVIGNGKIVAQGTLDELLAGAGTVVRALDTPSLAAALVTAGLSVDRRPDGSLHIGAGAEQVGRIAAATGAVLIELGEAGGLEELFFALTNSGADVNAAA